MSDNDLIRRGDALAAVKAIEREHWRLEVDAVYSRSTQEAYRQNHMAQSAAECVAAIAALPAVTPRVKPLVWENDAMKGSYPDRMRAVMPCRGGDYSVAGSRKQDKWQWFRNGYFVDGHQLHAPMPLEAAKAAAQADYEARIIAALDMQPAPDMERLIKDAERRGQIKAGAIFANYGTNEDDYAAAVHNACTHCNGSGHKDDVKPAPDAQAIRDAALREVTDRVGECLAGMDYSAVSRFAREKIFLALIGTTAEGGA